MRELKSCPTCQEERGRLSGRDVRCVAKLAALRLPIHLHDEGNRSPAIVLYTEPDETTMASHHEFCASRPVRLPAGACVDCSCA